MTNIFQFFQPTGFDAYFSNPSTTIVTLLLDQMIITELKNQNPNLLEYLTSNKQKFISQLIQYTTVMPQQSDGHDRCHRLPYISSELLAIDSDIIYAEFFKKDEETIQNKFWKQLLYFLDGEGAYNEILMGYFEKVINNLYTANKKETTKILANNFQRLVKLLPNGSISDILKKCMVLLNEDDGVVLDQRKLILNRIISVFVGSGEEVKVVCADILGEVINKFQTFSSGEDLVKDILHSETLMSIYTTERSEAVNDFLLTLLKKCQQRTINENDQKVPLLTLPQPHKSLLLTYLKHQSHNIIDISSSTGFIVNQNKQTVRKSNKSMYSLLKLIGVALNENLSSFVDEGLVSFLWNLVLLYPFNNILHVLVRKIFIGVLASDDKEVFLDTYQGNILHLGKKHLDMLRPFLYGIWMEAKFYNQVSTDPSILSQFQEFVEINLEPLVKYEIKSVQKQAAPPQKLIVDEEDSAPKEQMKQSEEVKEQSSEKVEEKGQNNEEEDVNSNYEEEEDDKQIIKSEVNPFKDIPVKVDNNPFEIQKQTSNEAQSSNTPIQADVDLFEAQILKNDEAEKQKNPEDAKDEFDFFTFSQTSQNNPVEEVKIEPKKDLFDDFATLS